MLKLPHRHNSMVRSLKSELEQRTGSTFYDDFSEIPKGYVGQLYVIGKLKKTSLKGDTLTDRNSGSLAISYANPITDLLTSFCDAIKHNEIWMRGVYRDGTLEVISCNVLAEDTLL